MYKLLLGKLFEVCQGKLMLGVAKGRGPVHAALKTVPCCRWMLLASPSIAPLIARRCTYTASATKEAVKAEGNKPRPRTLTSEIQSEQHQHGTQQPASPELPTADPQQTTLVKPRHSGKPGPSSAASPVQQLPAAHESPLKPSSTQGPPIDVDRHPPPAHQSADSGYSNSRSQHQQASRPIPRLRRSTTQSKSAADEQPHVEVGFKADKSRARATNSTAGVGSSQAEENVTARHLGLSTLGAATQAATASLGPSLTAADAAQTGGPSSQIQQQMEPNMSLRNKFINRRPAAPLIGPSSSTLSAAAAAWVQGLGIPSEMLQSWGAGMAVVQHPDLKQGQVEVLALPYYLAGNLVDVRYLQLSGGRLVGSWLAVGKGAAYMREQEAKAASVLVFVDHELDVILLSNLGIAAVAIPKQLPVMNAPTHATATAPTLQQEQEHQFQGQQQHWLPLLQWSGWRQQQQFSSVQQGYEDPRFRLEGLRRELENLKHEQSLSVSRPSSREGLLVTDVTQSYVSGLSLMFPAASTAVLAMDSGPVGEAVGAQLAGLLGEVACRHVLWPSIPPADAADGGAAAPGSLGQSAGLVQAPADAGSGDIAAAGDEAALAAEQTTTSQVMQKSLIAGLGQQLWQSGVEAWNFPLVFAIFGAAGVSGCVSNAYIWPIAGLERFSEHAADLLASYDAPDVGSLAVSTGWESLDTTFKVAPGEVTIVTGVPNSGKSEWLDALAVNLAHLHGWKFAVCSMEKRPRDHGKQLAEKVAGKPMLMASYAENLERMTEAELASAFSFVCEHFVVIASGEDKMPSIHWVLEKARAAKIQYGISGLIIDPYNELDPTRSSEAAKEHEHVNEVMSHLRKFARQNQVHCWLVAHPRQMGGGWAGQRPGLQDISGGANFSNKTDNGIVVHRDWSKMKELQQRAGRIKSSRKSSSSTSVDSQSDAAAAASEAGSNGNGAAGFEPDEGTAVPGAHRPEYEVQIFVEKVRNKTTGCKGDCVLVYDRVTGRYHELHQQPDRHPLGGQPLARYESAAQVEVYDDPQEQQQVEQFCDNGTNRTAMGSFSGPQEEEHNLERMRAASSDY